MRQNVVKRSASLLLAGVLLFGAIAFGGCGEKKQETKDEAADKEDYTLESQTEKESNVLTGISVACLGADLLAGTEDEISYAEYMAKHYNQDLVVKDAVRGSKMAGSKEDSYVSRIQKMDKKMEIDCLIVELPMADVTDKTPLGEAVQKPQTLEELDTDTYIGAMQYISLYAKQTWKCGVVFVNYIKQDGLKKTVDAAWAAKYASEGVVIVNMFDNLDASKAVEKGYSNDTFTELTEEGYGAWYVPVFEEQLLASYGAINSAKVNAMDQYDPARVEPLADSPLKGKKIIFLGSSVTFGSDSNEASFVEYLAARDGITYVKEAVSGTTLVDNGESSYIARMKANIPPQDADLFICQLSTNDATTGQPMGEISDSTSMEDFDTSTVIGAMEYVIAYAKENYHCPVMFYTGTKYDSDQYEEMVEATLELQEKWDIGVIDMWNNLDTDIPEYEYYMSNGIHPNRAGYLDWWTPYFEECITEYLKL